MAARRLCPCPLPAPSSKICANRRNLWTTGFGWGRRHSVRSVSRWWTIMQNEPNLRRRRVGRGQRDGGRRANAPNEPNLAPVAGRARRGMPAPKQSQFPAGPGGTGLGGRGAVGLLRQTKPISVRPELELNPLQKKVYAVCGRLTGPVKQSQKAVAGGR
jgi:hypothetical protein